MQPAEGSVRSRERDVEAATLERPLPLVALEQLAAFVEQPLEELLGGVRGRTRRPPLFGREFTDPAKHGRERAFLAEQPCADLLERVQVVGPRNRFAGLVLERRERAGGVCHGP